MEIKLTWNPTAAALIILAGTLGNSPGRYQFAPSSLDGQVLWRGDTVTGRVVLCATERFAAQAEAEPIEKDLVTRGARDGA